MIQNGPPQVRPFLSWKRILQHANPGDLLEFQRRWYTHYALYLGNGKVMNIKANESRTSALICEMTLEEACGRDLVRICNHDDVAQDHFGLVPKVSTEIIKDARMFENISVPYELTFRNCEYYVTLWRYGMGFSTQAALLKPPASYAYILLFIGIKLTGTENRMQKSSFLRTLKQFYQTFMSARYARPELKTFAKLYDFK